jgi:hypothetical protein
MISLIFFCLFSFWINILLTRLGQDLTISKRGLRRLIFSIENHINIHDDASQEDSTLKKKRGEEKKGTINGDVPQSTTL